MDRGSDPQMKEDEVLLEIHAAALPEAYGAAYLFLFYEGCLKVGDALLV